MEFKILVVDWLRRNQRNVSLAAREFSIDRKRVREWDQKYDLLQKSNKGASAKRRKISIGRPALHPNLDLKVMEFLEVERSSGHPVSNRALLTHASQLAGGPGIEGFKASQGWLWRFKRRNHIGYRCGTNSAQKVPADYLHQLQHFRKQIITSRKKHSIDPSSIVNMDQTMCRFDMPPKRTNHIRGAHTVRIKTTRAEKKGFTVALAADAAGNKLPAMIIFKERGGRLGDRVKKQLRIPSNVVVRLHQILFVLVVLHILALCLHCVSKYFLTG